MISQFRLGSGQQSLTQIAVVVWFLAGHRHLLVGYLGSGKISVDKISINAILTLSR
jgi:hypothetical protein